MTVVRDRPPDATASRVDLERLRALAEKATPGPWEVQSPKVRTSAFVGAPRFGYVCNAPVPASDWNMEFNATSQARRNVAFIAACDPQTILALLDRVAELENGLRPFVDRIHEFIGSVEFAEVRKATDVMVAAADRCLMNGGDMADVINAALAVMEPEGKETRGTT